MLTKRKNLIETIRGGKPDRFVKQYEFMNLIQGIPDLTKAEKGETVTNEWGVTLTFREDQPGRFPLHDDEHKVVKDVKQWKKHVKAPFIDESDEAWAVAKDYVSAIDREEEFPAVFIAPGIFEMTHYLMGIDDALISLYTEPDKMRELIQYLEEYEIERAKVIMKKTSPECIFHHDDWGTQISTFFSPKMFEDFFLPSYKRIYGAYKKMGAELIVHHSDSYGASLVPYMIELGVDIWQGVLSTNNTPSLIKKYGGKISFMGNIDSGIVDCPGWNKELIRKTAEKACRECGKLYFIPCLTQGLNKSTFAGVYEAADDAIEECSRLYF